MTRYLIRRLALALLVVVATSVLTFVLTRVVLGDPVQAILGGQGSTATPAQIEQLRHQLLLDQPIPAQYLAWMRGVVTGDLGRSFLRPEPVGAEIAASWPVTLELSVLAMALAVVLGIALGVVAGVRPGTWVDLLASTTSVLSLSLPNFFLGILLVFAFALWFHVLPTGGYVPITQDVGANLIHMVLPALTLSAAYVGSFARYTRSLMIRILGEEYIRRAVASGLPPLRVVGRHALRNAAIALVTVVGLNVAGLVGGAVVTETVFSLPGLGSLLTSAVLGKDLPTIQGVVLYITVGVVVLNLAVDLLYGVLDPRVRVA